MPGSKYGQAIWTTLGSSEYWGIRKTGVPEEVIEYLRKRAEQTGLFVPAGKELKVSPRPRVHGRRGGGTRCLVRVGNPGDPGARDAGRAAVRLTEHRLPDAAAPHGSTACA